MRPLEYWRNEKKTYGRSHNSLPTVKTVDLASPNPEWPAPKTKAKTKGGDAISTGAGAPTKGGRGAAPKKKANVSSGRNEVGDEHVEEAPLADGGDGSDTASEN